MVRWFKAARAVGGLLSTVVLLGLLVADVIWSRITVPAETVWLLLLLVGALLAVDRLVEDRLPVEITIGQNREDDGDQSE